MLTLHELTSQSLLEGLDDAELEKLLSLVSMVRLLRDEHVFREKGICKGIYMIHNGRIEISKTTPDGWKQPLVILNPGNFIGEIATLEKTDHATDARAIENAELILLPKAASVILSSLFCAARCLYRWMTRACCREFTPRLPRIEETRSCSSSRH